jgi:hypothetical protein
MASGPAADAPRAVIVPDALMTLRTLKGGIVSFIQAILGVNTQPAKPLADSR